MYYRQSELKKKTVGHSIFLSPPLPCPSKGWQDFRFGVSFSKKQQDLDPYENFLKKLDCLDSSYLWRGGGGWVQMENGMFQWIGSLAKSFISALLWGHLKFAPRNSAKKPWRLWIYRPLWFTNIGLICLKINYLQFFPGDTALCTWSRKGSFTTARWLSIFSKLFCISL